VQQLDDLVAGQFAGLPGGLDLVVVEVGRHGDEGRVEQVAAVVEAVGQQVAQQGEDAGRHLRRGEHLGADAEGLAEPHVPLDGGDGGGGAAPQRRGGPADDGPVLPGQVADEGGHGLAAVLVLAGDQGAVGGVEQGDDAVRRAQVDADGLADLHGAAR
jgi:hypothetical protein